MYRLALADNQSATEALVHERAATIARQDLYHRGEGAKQSYTLGYHVNIFGKKQLWEQQPDICQISAVDKVLPHIHQCSDTLYIRHQDLTSDELSISCSKLTSLEEDFHTLLATGKQPVANDHNEALQVVTFTNWSQYNAYGQLFMTSVPTTVACTSRAPLKTRTIRPASSRFGSFRSMILQFGT